MTVRNVRIPPAVGSAAIMYLALQFFAPPNEVRRSQNQTESKHFAFKWDGSGRTAKKGVLQVSFSRFKAEDGVTVERSVEQYQSDTRAKNRLASLISKASQVIESGSKKAWDGNLVGKRVQLDARDPKQQSLYIVAWTDGSRVFVLHSKSLPHLLGFEQQDYPASPPKRVRPSSAPKPTLPLPHLGHRIGKSGGAGDRRAVSRSLWSYRSKVT